MMLKRAKKTTTKLLRKMKKKNSNSKTPSNSLVILSLRVNNLPLKKEVSLRKDKENYKKRLKPFKKKKFVLKKCLWPKLRKKKLKLNFLLELNKQNLRRIFSKRLKICLRELRKRKPKN